MRKLVVALIIGAALGSQAFSAPPPDADTSLAPWFQGLRQPITGMSCCSIADCRPADERIVGDHYEVFVDNKWRQVPADKVLPPQENPVGRAVVCYTPDRGVMCFVRASGV